MNEQRVFDEFHADADAVGSLQSDQAAEIALRLIREAQAQAWDRGQHAAFGFSVENPHFTPSDMVGTKYDNPYRKEH